MYTFRDVHKQSQIRETKIQKFIKQHSISETEYVRNGLSQYENEEMLFTHDELIGFIKQGYHKSQKFITSLKNDPEKSYRLSDQICPYCYYLTGQAVGMAFTQFLCQRCHRKLMSSTTSIDVLCPDCAKKLHACKHCGASLNLKSYF